MKQVRWSLFCAESLTRGFLWSLSANARRYSHHCVISGMSGSWRERRMVSRSIASGTFRDMSSSWSEDIR